MAESAQDQLRDLQCPRCGYVLVNNSGIGAVYCGPHIDSYGHEWPAVQMLTIRDWDEFKRENGFEQIPQQSKEP